MCAQARACVYVMSSVSFMCVQLAPVLENPLSHQQEPAVTEPGLHKDDLESILGDVSDAHLHECEHACKPLATHKMAAMLLTQVANLCECLCLEAGRKEKMWMKTSFLN